MADFIQKFIKTKKIGDIAAVVAFLCVAILILVIAISCSNGKNDEIVIESATETAETTENMGFGIVTEPDGIPEGVTTVDTGIIGEETDVLTLEDLEIGDTSWAYFIVNRTNPVPDNYDNNIEFEGLWSNGKYYYIDARIADYAQCMINDAARDGVTLYACSIYRTLASQTANFNNRIKAYAQAKYSYEDAYTYTSRYIAVPGTSEHHTGLAIDFITPGYMYLDDGFENTAAYKWLSENCYKYGFIMRYPSDKAAETGINYEPWHFRFIGFEYAEDIYNSGLCLEEYMALDDSVEINPMTALVIPEKPAWYDAYINSLDDTNESNSDETDSGETNSGETNSDETDSDETNSDETASDETDSDETNSDETDSDETEWEYEDEFYVDTSESESETDVDYESDPSESETDSLTENTETSEESTDTASAETEEETTLEEIATDSISEHTQIDEDAE